MKIFWCKKKDQPSSYFFLASILVIDQKDTLSRNVVAKKVKYRISCIINNRRAFFNIETTAAYGQMPEASKFERSRFKIFLRTNQCQLGSDQINVIADWTDKNMATTESTFEI